MMRKLAILGATGSIGQQTFDVLRTCMPHAQVCAISGYRNVAALAMLVDEFSPAMAWVPDAEAAKKLAGLIHVPCEILTGDAGLIACAAQSDADVVVNALVGQAGLAPTLAAIAAGKNIALANKESLVTAGGLIMEAARAAGVRITPIDSEHSAIWQCLQGNDYNPVEKIILTASGGPFRTWPREKIAAATAADALRHPKWNMGHKITIDSATLMNKGLELIEAMWLFGQRLCRQGLDTVEILVHPQSIIHSMVQFTDGAIMAQMGLPDMRLPILYALAGPSRVANDFPRLNFLTHNTLTFEAPDMERFPCLALARFAADTGGTLPAVMNTVNEWAVGQFLCGKLDFYGISQLIEDVFGAYTVKPVTCAQDIWTAQAWAQEYVTKP